jgi:hypothetical protein
MPQGVQCIIVSRIGEVHELGCEDVQVPHPPPDLDPPVLEVRGHSLDTSDLAIKVVKEMEINRDKLIVLDRKCIEDYYPVNVLVEAMNCLLNRDYQEGLRFERAQR